MPDLSPTDMSDEELVHSILNDTSFFGILIERYEDKLKRYVIRISGVSVADAEDICQDVFIKVYKNIRGFDTTLSFSSWIYRIAHNEARSFYRKHKKREQTYSLDDTDYDQLASDLQTDGLVIDAERREVLTLVLGDLKEEYREVLILNFLEEKSYTEISDILKKPVGSVGTLLHRAKKQLKQILQKKGITTSYDG